MSWGFFYEFTWERASLTVTKVPWRGMILRWFGMKKGRRPPCSVINLCRFPLATSCHQFVDGFSRRLSAIQNCVHLSGDWHLHLAESCQLNSRARGKNTLGHHTVHACNDVGQFTTPTELYTDAAITRQSSGAGQYQVTQPGESGHGLRLAAAGHNQAGHFRQAAGDQRRNRIMAQTQAVTNPSRDRDGILQRPSEFHANDVAVGVNPKLWVAEALLHRFRQTIVRRCDGDGRRVSPRHFLRKRGSTERAYTRSKPPRCLHHLYDYFRHPQMSLVFQSLGGTDDQCLRIQAIRHLLKNSPAVMRWHHADHDRCIARRYLIVAGSGYGFGQFVPGQKEIITVTLVDRVLNFLLVRPQSHLVRPLASESDG